MVDINMAVNFAILLGASAILAGIWWYSRTERYALYWAGKFFLPLFGWSLLALPVPENIWLALAIGIPADLIFLASFWLFARGTALYLGLDGPRARWLVLAITPFAAGWLALALGSLSGRELGASLGTAVVQGWIVFILLHRMRPDVGHLAVTLSNIAIFLVNAGYGWSIAHQLIADPFRIDFAALAWLMAGMPVASASAAMCGVLAVCLRLVERSRDQARELERTIEAAREADQAKAQFLANISHEIRTPVNAILGGIDILRSTDLDERQAECVRLVGKAGRSLLSQMDDLLDVTRMQAGHITLETVTFDLHQRLRDLVDMMVPQAEEKGLQVGLAIAPAVPCHVSGDPARMDQILLNLLGNAVKFTDTGAVMLNATVAGDVTDGRQRIRFSVSDSGIGIPAAKQALIFDPFTQADGSTARRFGGTGLGLAIARGLVHMMDGRIWVESVEGLGSTFHVELPLHPTALSAMPKDEASISLPVWSSPRTLLLVEDEPVNRFVATELLRRHGFEIVAAVSGAEALEILGKHRVDAILMDLGMPEMDGFETAARVRAVVDPAVASTPIVALTANILPETRDRCLAAGMAGFVGKPIRIAELLGTLASILPPSGWSGGPMRERMSVSPDPVRLDSLRCMVGDATVQALLDQAMRNIAAARAVLADPKGRPARRRIAEIAHGLAGTLDAVGFIPAADAARVLEVAARARDSAAFDARLAELLWHLDSLTGQPVDGSPRAVHVA